jgi:hypothetical protein
VEDLFRLCRRGARVEPRITCIRSAFARCCATRTYTHTRLRGIIRRAPVMRGVSHTDAASVRSRWRHLR